MKVSTKIDGKRMIITASGPMGCGKTRLLKKKQRELEARGWEFLGKDENIGPGLEPTEVLTMERRA